MAYIKERKAHSTHHIQQPNGSVTQKHNRYETGHITGRYRDIPAVIADKAGFDGLGFDATVDSNDDSWHVASIFDRNKRYMDTIAIGGAFDSLHAKQIAESQLSYLGGDSCVVLTNPQFDSVDDSNPDTWSIDSLNKLLDNPSQNKSFLPVITAPELNVEASRVTFDSVQWGDEADLISHGGKYSRLYLDLTRADTRNELVADFDLAESLYAMDAKEASFDALMETKQRLTLLRERLLKALVRVGDDELKVTDATQTKEFKRQGVINIAFVFDLSDGQKLSIWFHKPSTMPSKLLPSDTMISWKWMLNKRDVTAALSPKQGDNVQLPVLARRIMRVAAKNSKRFKATQARKLADAQALLDAEKLIEDKNAIIGQLDADIADLNSKIDAAMKAPTADTVNESGMQGDTPAGGIFSEGDAVIWISNGSEISRGIFKQYSPTDSESAIFVDDGGNMKAPVSELIFDPDMKLTDEQIAAKSQADEYNKMEDIIKSLSTSSKRFREWDMTIESVKALPIEQFYRLSDELARARLYGRDQLLQAYRTGRQDLIDMAQSILDNERSSGGANDEIIKRRDRLGQILKTELTLVGTKRGAKDTPAETPAQTAAPVAGAIPIREALDYVKANIFEGKDDQVLMYVTDRSTGEIKETKLVKASSKSAQTRWSNKFIYDDTTGSVYNQSIPKTNTNAATLLEDLGYKIDYADPDGFTDDQFQIGDVYGFRGADDAYDYTGNVMQFKEWVYTNRGNDEAGLSFSSFSGATGKTILLSEMRELVASRKAVKLSDVDAQKAKQFQTEEPVSVYVNSKGRVLATVTKQYGGYNVKGENFSGGSYPDDASVLKQLEVVKQGNPSMKLKEGKEFFSDASNAKTYPPLEYDDGSVIAYMNSKKKDSWTAMPQADGGFIVYADNAQTRAYNSRTPKFFDNSFDLETTYPAFKGINAFLAQHSTDSDDEDYEDIDQSEYPNMFLNRNRDKLNILGIGDGDIQVGSQDRNDTKHDDLYHIDTGIFANMTLNFADAVCKIVDAAIDLGGDAVVGDYTATAYQDSMFDALTSKSNPVYGITVQISKDGVNLRAEIDAYGEAKILKGNSGQDVIATIKHVFTDNTGEYKSAIEDVFNAQAGKSMDKKKELEDQAQAEFNEKLAEQTRLNQEAKARLNLSGTTMDNKAGTNVGDIIDSEGRRSTNVHVIQVADNKVYFGATYGKDKYTADMTFTEFEAAIERAKQAGAPAAEPIDRKKMSAGDAVVWRNENGEIKGNFRGYTDDGQKVVLVANGSQMAAPAEEVFIDDTPANTRKSEALDISKADKTNALEYASKLLDLSREKWMPSQSYSDIDDWTDAEQSAAYEKEKDLVKAEIDAVMKAFGTLKQYRSYKKDQAEIQEMANLANRSYESGWRGRSSKGSEVNQFFSPIFRKRKGKIYEETKKWDAVSEGHVFPPVEKIGKDEYRAYRDSNKRDHWTAKYEDYGRGWAVTIDTERSRSLKGVSKLRFFNNIDDIINEYPAFKGVKELIAKNANTTSEPASNALADRVNEIEQQLNAPDFDPMAIDTDELIELVDKAEGDKELSAKIDAISVTLQQKMVAISMKALADMAGA